MSLSTLSRINDVLYEIHRDISADLPVKHLAQIAAFSEQHFHRVFCEHMGESVHRYISRIRLEQAANLLMFDHVSEIIDIAHKCGYQSLSSFGKAFKTRLGLSPGEWRKHHTARANPDFMQDPVIAAGYRQVKNLALPTPVLEETPSIRVAYIRHKGYNREIQFTWQRLLAWAGEHNIKGNTQYALHHSNPTWVPLAECRYVACIASNEPLYKRTLVNTLVIPGGLHAKFHLRGNYGEFVPYLSRVISEWAPISGFKPKTTPAWVQYNRNQFIDEESVFDLLLYIPLSLY